MLLSLAFSLAVQMPPDWARTIPHRIVPIVWLDYYDVDAWCRKHGRTGVSRIQACTYESLGWFEMALPNSVVTGFELSCIIQHEASHVTDRSPEGFLWRTGWSGNHEGSIGDCLILEGTQ